MTDGLIRCDACVFMYRDGTLWHDCPLVGLHVEVPKGEPIL